jgi:hypothetical protein
VGPIAAHGRHNDATVGAGEVDETNTVGNVDHLRRANELVLHNVGIDAPSRVAHAIVPDVDTTRGTTRDDMGDAYPRVRGALKVR